jgi:hypothetical protein
MNTFVQKFGSVIHGILSGFDRLFFRGTLRNLAYPGGLQHYLWANRVPFKDFDQHSKQVSARLEEASLRCAQQSDREIRYLNSHKVRLEDEARAVAARDRITQGPICVFRRVEPCMSFEIHGHRATRKLRITYRPRQCLHLYHYQFHPVFGFMHARIQTWFPFHAYVCINGHEWLARQMDQAGLRYQRRDNGFPWVEDVAQAQALFDQQLQTHWPALLNDLALQLNPIHGEMFRSYPTQYYWSVAQSEWSSDVLFRSRADLQALYPRLVRHAITTYGAVDVLRFLGRKIPEGGEVPPGFAGEVQSDLKCREEGVRVKHWLNHNSLKLYDKGSVLRPEVTINDPGDFRVYRPREGDPDGAKAWRPLRYGVADLHRRAEVCQAANARYLEALAAVAETTPLRRLVEPVCRPVSVLLSARPARAADQAAAAAVALAAVVPADRIEPAAASVLADSPDQPAAPMPADGANPLAARLVAVEAVAPPPDTAEVPVGHTAASATPPRRRRRVRALNPLGAEDGTLLEAVSRHEFLINGLRNRDLRRLLFPTEPATAQEQRRRSGVITRKLRLLRAHGLLHKVAKTHRYVVSEQGRKVITTVLAARDANADLLTENAA